MFPSHIQCKPLYVVNNPAQYFLLYDESIIIKYLKRSDIDVLWLISGVFFSH